MNNEAIISAYHSICQNIITELDNIAGCRVITLSSPESKDGRTTTAINLAVALSKMGKKTLIIDSDMLNAAVQTKLRISSVCGLSELLMNRCELDKAITFAGENLDVITAGSFCENGQKLLAAESFENLISSLRFAYDYIVIDSAPVCDSEDFYYTSKQSDGFVLILRDKKSKYTSINSAFELIENASVNLIGTVINASKE